jgi:hypothetical protein
MKKINHPLKIALILMGAFIVLIILILGYYGFIPFLSDLMGISRPKDLGVRYTEADLKSAYEKTGLNMIELQETSVPIQTLSIQGERDIEVEFTQEELTALINDHHERWRYYPVERVQFKINNDGTFETSGLSLPKRSNHYSDATNMPDNFRREIVNRITMFQAKTKFYFKGSFEINNGELDGDLTDIEAGRIATPEDWFQNNKDFVKSFVNNRIKEAGITPETVKIQNGNLYVKGKIPETVGFSK